MSENKIWDLKLSNFCELCRSGVHCIYAILNKKGIKKLNKSKIFRLKSFSMVNMFYKKYFENILKYLR